MNTSVQARPITSPIIRYLAAGVSPQVRLLMALGQHFGWPFTVLGQAPMPDRPMRYGDWLIVPAGADSTPLPAHAQRRAQAVLAAGIRPQGFLVVHEAPRLLPAHAGEKVPGQLPLRAMSPKLRSLLKTVGVALGAVGVLLTGATGAAVLAVAALSLAALLMVLALLVVGAVLIDPILVVVTEDGYWVEIDRWWD